LDDRRYGVSSKVIGIFGLKNRADSGTEAADGRWDDAESYARRRRRAGAFSPTSRRVDDVAGGAR